MPTMTNRERVANKWFPLINSVYVDLVRSCSVSPDLTEIEWRRLDAVEVQYGQGDRHTLRLKREEAEWLRDALDEALARTSEFAKEEEA